MKFSDGLWLNQRGYEVNYAVQAYETTTTANSITVFATPTAIWNRGMTLGGVCLEITYTSTAPDIIKVTIRHHKGAVDNRPKFELNEDWGYTPEITQGEGYIEMKTGETVLRIKQGTDWEVSFSRNGKHLTGGAWRSTSYIKESQFHANARLALQEDDQCFNFPQDPHTGFTREQLSLCVGECVYGFGEKFTTFVKNGQNVEMWNADGGTSSDQSYKCIPFYITSNGYGVFVNSADKVSFEVGSDTVNKVSFTVPGETLEYFFIGGENLQKVLENYTTLTGKPALPPAKTFGLWLSTSFTTDYNEETVTSFIDGMAERDIPLQMFHFDCFWMREFHWTDFEWDTRQFPDPKAMLSRLKERGLGLCCWINPYIAQQSALFDEGAEKGYFIKNPDGSVFQFDMWQPGMAIVDFTNPDACKWFSAKLRTLLEMGVTAIKTDFGERIPTKVKYFSGEDPIHMHNYYTYLYNKVVFETLKDFYGENQACLFARSATVGGQKFPVHWGGDCTGEYSSMAETLRGGLSLCASGFGYFSHDIGGFEASSSPSVYKRWCAFGLMSSHSRLHGSTSYRVPWVYDDEACDVLRFFTKLKGKLMPYLFAQAVKTSATGVPMMRAMVIDYTDDIACRYLDQQYMLGDSLLCAPVFNEEGIANIYLPEGKWYDIITGKTLEGGKYHSIQCSFMEMPVLAKPNSILAMGNFENQFEYDYAEGADFMICNLEDGKSASTEIYDVNAKLVLTLRAERSGDTITITASESDKTFTVSVAGTDKKVTMTGTQAVITL
ncbi:MAG: alpha-xylosidase [Ruminococcus sp.]|nr:alpha-xylosidase [Ruminococcus sp.]